MRRFSTRDAAFDTQLTELLAFESAQDRDVEDAVQAILADVKQRGGQALLEYTRRFDRVDVRSTADLAIEPDECDRALRKLPAAQRAALEAAVERVRTYHEHQVAHSWSFRDADGNELGQRIIAIDRVGIYVPGGKAAYPSSVIMNALPAQVAGVREIVMAVPTPDGERNALVLAAAALCGVRRIFAIGGAQAIGALAYGTDTVPAVDKIVGPGNAYVAAAKRRVFGSVGIDMIAGPSEILVISDGRSDPDWIAMDLFSQAEHDEQAQAVLVCPDGAFIDAVESSIERQLPSMSRRDIIRGALSGRGALIETRDLAEACDVANRMAPEHLELSVEDPDAILDQIRHAGAIFMGPYASESLGDYCAGPNHVLPTSRTARFSSPLGVYDFQKRSSVIRVSRQGARKLGAIAAELAYGEGLTAHARAAELRMK
jgi:histidinol dehydrogenase